MFSRIKPHFIDFEIYLLLLISFLFFTQCGNVMHEPIGDVYFHTLKHLMHVEIHLLHLAS